MRRRAAWWCGWDGGVGWVCMASAIARCCVRVLFVAWSVEQMWTIWTPEEEEQWSAVETMSWQRSRRWVEGCASRAVPGAL